MIERIDITGVHTTVTPELHKYIQKKFARLDRYVPRHARESVHVEVKLKEHKAKDKKQCTCEVIFHVPHDVIATKESTMNMFAAIDIVEAKLRNQLKKYKDTHGVGGLRRKVITKFRRSSENNSEL